MRFFDLLLCAGLLLLAGFVVRLDFRDARSVNRLTTTTALSQAAPAAIRTLSGFDRLGKPTDQLPGGTKHVAIFLMHGATFRAEADLWNSARGLYPTMEFAGVCGDAACIRQAAATRGKLNFTVATMGDYYALRRLLLTDDGGKFMVLNRESGAIREVDTPKSSAELTRLKSILPENQ